MSKLSGKVLQLVAHIGEYTPSADMNYPPDANEAIRNVFGDWPQSLRHAAFAAMHRQRRLPLPELRRMYLEGSDPANWRVKSSLTREQADKLADTAPAPRPSAGTIPDNVFGGLNWDS